MSEKRKQEIYNEVRQKSMFADTYHFSTYAGEKRMYEILKTLNTIIDNCWELVGLYDCSELENQHDGISMDDIEDLAVKVEDIRATLFGDSLNYKRIAELCKNQVEEIHEKEKEFTSLKEVKK